MPIDPLVREKAVRAADRAIRRVDRLTDTQVAKLRRTIAEAQRHVRNRIAGYDPTRFTAAHGRHINAELEAIVRYYDPQVQGIARTAMDEAWDLGIARPAEELAGVWRVEMPGLGIGRELLEVAHDHTAHLLTNVTAEVIRRVSTEVRLGLMSGESPWEVMQRVGRRLPDKGPFKTMFHRAEAVVRTETGRAYEMGHRASALQAAAEIPGLMEQWVTCKDERVREDHIAMHGKTKRVKGEMWNVAGSEADYPKDPRLPAAQSVNCRCTTVLLPSEAAPAAATGEPTDFRLDFDEDAARAAMRYQNDMWMMEGLSEASPCYASSDTRQYVKNELVERLSERLRGNKAYAQLTRGMLQEVQLPIHQFIGRDDSYNVTSFLVQTWADTSADRNPLALALQRAAVTEFGLAAETLTVYSPQQLQLASEMFTKYRPGLQAFLRAQYQVTQAYLKAHGVKEVIVYRGMNFHSAAEAQSVTGLKFLPDKFYTTQGTVRLQPMSSFALDISQATSFAAWDNSMVMAAKVPVSRVLSTARTGVGCLTETEVVILGSPKDAVRIVTRGSSATPWRMYELLSPQGLFAAP